MKVEGGEEHEAGDHTDIVLQSQSRIALENSPKCPNKRELCLGQHVLLSHKHLQPISCDLKILKLRVTHISKLFDMKNFKSA